MALELRRPNICLVLSMADVCWEKSVSPWMYHMTIHSSNWKNLSVEAFQLFFLETNCPNSKSNTPFMSPQTNISPSSMSINFWKTYFVKLFFIFIWSMNGSQDCYFTFRFFQYLKSWSLDINCYSIFLGFFDGSIFCPLL